MVIREARAGDSSGSTPHQTPTGQTNEEKRSCLSLPRRKPLLLASLLFIPKLSMCVEDRGLPSNNLISYYSSSTNLNTFTCNTHCTPFLIFIVYSLALFYFYSSPTLLVLDYNANDNNLTPSCSIHTMISSISSATRSRSPAIRLAISWV